MLLDDLKSVSPTTFEHLAFDLLVLSGFQNVTWRTPGADGGRDIEAQVIAEDMSGVLSRQRWYVECKRYATSLDWPAVYQKIAYADNHGADFLLMCTTATLSPRCKEELQSWERHRRRLQIRYWDGPTLENRVGREQWLLVKYGLAHGPLQADAFSQLVTAAHKSVQTSYARAALDAVPDRALELAAALLELIDARAADASSGTVRRSFKADRDGYAWLHLEQTADFSAFDGPGLRAVLSGLRFYTKADEIRFDAVRAPDAAARLGEPALAATATITPKAKRPWPVDALALVGVAAHLEVALVGDDVVRFEARKVSQ